MISEWRLHPPSDNMHAGFTTLKQVVQLKFRIYWCRAEKTMQLNGGWAWAGQHYLSPKIEDTGASIPKAVTDVYRLHKAMFSSTLACRLIQGYTIPLLDQVRLDDQWCLMVLLRHLDFSGATFMFFTPSVSSPFFLARSYNFSWVNRSSFWALSNLPYTVYENSLFRSYNISSPG